jgi:hypothetical protein
LSVIEFPPVTNPTFGLIQEEFAHDPFKLLIAVTLLNKTRGSFCIPVFRSIIDFWPTPTDLASAPYDEVLHLLMPLGFQTKRTEILLSLAQSFVNDPPVKGRRYRTLNYPIAGAGKDITRDEILTDNDPRIGAWEIAHLKGVGAYAWDSWRIFCRDNLRGLASSFNGQDAKVPGSEVFEPEWKRVQPSDKELRAFLRWMWLREGILWNPVTGEKVPASEEVMARAEKGDVAEWDVEVAGLGGIKAEKPSKDIFQRSVPSTPRRAKALYMMPLG